MTPLQVTWYDQGCGEVEKAGAGPCREACPQIGQRETRRGACGFIYVPYWAALLGRGFRTRELSGRSFQWSPTTMQGEAETWAGDIVHTSQSEPYAPQIRYDRPRLHRTVTIGDVDLPAFLSNGIWYIQAPLPLVFEAFAESLPEFVRDLEVRVSDQRGRALPLAGNGRAVHRKRMAKPSVVRSGRKS